MSDALAGVTKMRRQIATFAEKGLPRSIVAWFVVCWAAFLLASVLVGGLLWSLYRQSTYWLRVFLFRQLARVGRETKL